MGGDDVDVVRDGEPRGVRLDDERAVGALALVRHPGEHDVELGQPGVGDPRLLALEHPRVAIGVRGGAHGRDVRARLGLGDGERGDARAGHDAGQIALLEGVAAEQDDRPAPQALHREGEVREPRLARQRLPRQAERAHVEAIRAPAERRRHDLAQPPGVSEPPDERATVLGHGVRRRLVLERERRRPRVELARQRAMPLLEEGPVEEGAVRHQVPSNDGRCFATNASYART